MHTILFPVAAGCAHNCSMIKTTHPGLKLLVSHINDKCNDNGIELMLMDKPYIPFDEEGEVNISGCFDSDAMTLRVATRKPEMEWVEILIHESCHMDQYVDNADIWNDTNINDVDTNTILDLWLKHVVELKPKQLDTVIRKIIDLERDCDSRVVDKVKKYELHDIIDVNTYYRKSNAYHLSYHIVRKLRRWNKPMHSPYMIKDMYMLFPDRMMDTYSMSKKLTDIIIKRCY